MKWTPSTSDFIPIGCEAMDLNNDIRDLDSEGKEENQPSINSQNVRILNRRKKSPLTRSEDFLWE